MFEQAVRRPERHPPISGQDGAVTVVGAGPAGLACAIALARAGRRVVVHEWHGSVGSRFHDDYQGLENWSDQTDVLEELVNGGVAACFDHHAIKEGIAFDHAGIQFEIRSRRPLFYLVRRGPRSGSLDRGLLEQAQDLGVTVVFGDRVKAVEGPAVLAAGPRRADAIAVGYIFDTNAADGCWLVLDQRLAPLGYGYLLVHEGRGTIATCMFTGFRNQAEHLQQTVAFFCERLSVEMHNPQAFGGFANFRLPRVAIQGGHLVVGEQAGFQDALAGFGMRHAFRSGFLAARSIIQQTDYAALWRDEIQPSLRAAVVNRFLFSLAGEAGRSHALRMLSEGDAGATLRRFYRPSLLSNVLFPVARLRYRALLRDQSCGHEDCRCVWCQCQTERKAATWV